MKNHGYAALLAALLLTALLAACQDSVSPPPPPWIHGRAYVTLRYYDQRACFYREAEQTAETGSPTMRWALRNDALWSGRYDVEAARLERAGHPTPTESAMFGVLCQQ